MHKGDLITTVSGGAGTTGGAYFLFSPLFSLFFHSFFCSVPFRRRSPAGAGIKETNRRQTFTPCQRATLPLMYWMTRKTKRNIRRAYPRRARNCPLEVQRYCPSSARKTPPALPMTQRGDINHERKTKGHTSKKDRQR